MQSQIKKQYIRAVIQGYISARETVLIHFFLDIQCLLSEAVYSVDVAGPVCPSVPVPVCP